ncbi:hypothetical protein CDL15_Pgr022741 [Punica granatum]|uniref:DUF668 domain-containing protein n=1 Tax=Punica granatum TaxID=22663 RepID=A0A218XS44_PUNGR|nr:hypothetical protein CDL15_Pgr022741 [Punica granatum]
MVAESWFRSLWGKPRKHGSSNPPKSVIGVLAFEFASLMSKSVHLWQSLSDKNITRLREEIASSPGIQKLVSDDEDFIANLIRSEMIENVVHVAKSVARLGHRCNDPSLKNFGSFFESMMALGLDPLGWKFTSKKMESKVKKMERFISMNVNLYQEMEVLGDLEQTLRRMKGSESSDPGSLLEYQKKVVWKRHEVKNLQGNSLWNKNYDYAVLLLARSLFTIFARIKQVFGIQQVADFGDPKDSNSKVLTSTDYIYRSQSVSALLQASVHPAEDHHQMRFSSGPLGSLMAKSGPTLKANLMKNFYSGPLVESNTKTTPVPGKDNGNVGFYSGPLGKLTKSGPLFGVGKIARGVWQSGKGHSSVVRGKKSNSKTNQLTSIGPLKGCMTGGDVNSANLESNQNRDIKHEQPNDGSLLSFSSEHSLLNAPPESLGYAGLALHYANVIIVIEKLAASPHLIGLDARDDLYNMLPATVRSSLRARLKPYANALSSYDPVLAGEWSEAITGILEWLGPLAHNMIRWQSERSFEQQNLVSRANVLVVQTLYFANKEKTEAIITELLVGLNYIWRFGRELNSKALVGCASSRAFDEYLDIQG